MTAIYLAEQVRELDRITIEEYGVPGVVLMRRAAEACVDALLESWPEPGRVSVLCGSGNNAGDGFIIAGILKNKGIDVSVGLIGKIPADGTDAGEAYSFCEASGVAVTTADNSLRDCTFIVDALLGTGLSGDVRPEYEKVIGAINGMPVPVLSVDLPSGLCSDTGNILGCCVRASVTVTFIGRKLGLLTNDGPEYSGRLVYADLEVPSQVFDEMTPAVRAIDYDELILKLPPRHRNAHKLNHGHLLVVGGAEGMGGAVTMAGEAAMYAGAGMVSVATHPSSVAGLNARRPEIMARGVVSGEDLEHLIQRASTIVLGPGLGTGDWGRDMFATVVAATESREVPLVIDADGLNLLVLSDSRDGIRKRENWVLTPHPGEAGRLLDRDVQSDRLQAVRALQEKYGGIGLLKGSGTLIATREETFLCPYGNPGMSVAGMGDVLAGVIGGLLAQGLPLATATLLGASVHSLAADELVAAQGEKGLFATELLPGIRRLVNHRPG